MSSSEPWAPSNMMSLPARRRLCSCGWFDAVILRRAIDVNSISGICLTKLDVLDGLETINICVGYKNENGACFLAPLF